MQHSGMKMYRELLLASLVLDTPSLRYGTRTDSPLCLPLSGPARLSGRACPTIGADLSDHRGGALKIRIKPPSSP